MLTIKDFELALEEETHLLPDQSPLEHFVHHNNLHHFEHKDFDTTVEDVYKNYGKTPYMPLSYYRDKLAKNEISRIKLQLRIKQALEFDATLEIIDYIIDHLFKLTDAKQIQFHHQENLIFDREFKKLIKISESHQKVFSKIRDLKSKFNDYEINDYHVNKTLERADKLLIPFYATLIDQGQANTSISSQDKDTPWELFLVYLKTILTNQQLEKLKEISLKEDQIHEFLFNRYFSKFNSKEKMHNFLRLNLQSTPGWAGMFYKTNKNKEVTPRRNCTISLSHFLLFRLLLNEIFEIEEDNEKILIYSDFLLKHHVFHFTHFSNNKNDDLQLIYNIFCQFTPTSLKRIFHHCYEETYGDYILSGLQKNKIKKSKTPKYQIYFCIDDREESTRRYLEEESDLIETFGVAGFFGLDMNFQGSNELFPRRMCPPAANPSFLIKEVKKQKRKGLKKLVKSFFYDGNTNLLPSLAKNFILTILKAIIFKAQLYFPRKVGKFLMGLENAKDQSPINYLQTDENKASTYSIKDAAARVAAILRGAGTIKNFSKYLIFIGHGHDSFNNPHVAAYRCGACSGANGSPNAKVFAEMGNNLSIRSELRNEYNIDIPNDTYFISGYHDTCNDLIEFYNLDKINISHDDKNELLTLINQARCNNAKERILKFYQSNKSINGKKALKFVEGRAWNIAEPRPELNHASNALCIVGKRSLTKNIFLDRKSFLVSYDQEIDEKGKILEGLLRAVMPVCSGINLEYYFSKVDTENYGSGSKTSHNVTGLTGVMNGIRGDLRTGLVWQMVEYHDPLRIMFIVETSEEIIQTILKDNKNLHHLVSNNWIFLTIIDPKNNQIIKRYTNEGFVPFTGKTDNFPKFAKSAHVNSTQTNPCHLAFIGE